MRNALTARRREALRLDLEDRRQGLRAEFIDLTRRPGGGVPPCACSIERCLRELDRVHLALERMEQATFGSCVVCGGAIPFEDLAADATRRCCASACVLTGAS